MIINYWLPNDLSSPSLQCFLKNADSFVSGVENDDLESFSFLFSYGLSFWNTEWNLGEILEWKQLTSVQTFQLLSNCYFFWRKKKKSISYGCMGTDQLKDNEDYDRGWTAQSSILSHYEMIQCEDLLFLLL